MAVTQEEVIAALREVYDPELHRNIVDLHMVRRVEIEDGHVEVEIALTVAGCPLQRTIDQTVKERLLQLPGVTGVDVIMGVMSEEERKRLVSELRPNLEIRSSILDEDSRTRIIAVASGKGGVGKSTVSANLAVALARQGRKVGIMDADIYGFSIPHILGVDTAPVVLEDQAIVPQTAHGVQVISMGSFVNEDTPIVWRGPMLTKAFQQFLGDVLWADLDYLIIDMPPGTGDVALSLYQLIPRSMLLLVTTPQIVAANVAARVAAMARKTHQRLLGVIENMAYFLCPHCGERSAIFGEGAGEELAARLHVPVLAQLPLLVPLREASDKGQPLADEQLVCLFDDLALRVEEVVRQSVNSQAVTPGTGENGVQPSPSAAPSPASASARAGELR